jgi:hypothetical protein
MPDACGRGMPEQGAGSRGQGAWGRDLGARSQEPGARSQEPAASSKQPAASSQQPAASSQQPGAGGCEPRTANREPRTANCELRTANCELRTASGSALHEAGHCARLKRRSPAGAGVDAEPPAAAPPRPRRGPDPIPTRSRPDPDRSDHALRQHRVGDPDEPGDGRAVDVADRAVGPPPCSMQASWMPTTMSRRRRSTSSCGRFIRIAFSTAYRATLPEPETPTRRPSKLRPIRSSIFSAN